MGSWVMAVEVTPSELVAVDVDRSDRSDRSGGSLRPRRVPLAEDGDGADPVDVLADAFSRLVAAPDRDEGADDQDRPARLVVATPSETERRRFEEIAEATALVGLPAPAWLPGPVALVGDRIAAEVDVGGQSVVLDARGDGLTAWPVRRTGAGAEIGSRGPVATGIRLDQLLLGVVRGQLHSLDPAGTAGAGPSPGARGAGAARDLRGEAARLRRGIRRARAQLAGTDVAEARVAAEEHEVVVDRGVFDELVEHALSETLDEVTDGPDEPGHVVVHVLCDRPTPLARRLAALTAGPARADAALVLPGSPDDGVLGMAALLLPARPRPARAASGAQAIRAARAVGSPPAPVGAAAGGVPGGPSDGAGPGLGDGDPERAGDPDAPGPRTPSAGLPLLDGSADADTAIPAARLPSSPVQAQHRGATTGAVAGAATLAPGSAPDAGPAPTDPAGADEGPDGADDRDALRSDDLDQAHRGRRDRDGSDPEGAHRDGSDPDGPAPGAAPEVTDLLDGHDGDDAPAVDDHAADHLVLAGALPHEVRPANATPPGGRFPATPPRAVRATGDDPDGEHQRSGSRDRRGPDTAPQPVAEPGRRVGRAPRGVVPVLVVLVVLAVLAAVGVLLVGPDQIDAAFTGLGAGTGMLPLDP